MPKGTKDLGVRDKKLLEQALTHSSYAHIHHTCDNERLEFLGDAILSAIVAEALYRKHPAWTEGQLTELRAQIVRGKSLAEAARTLGLEAHLRHTLGDSSNPQAMQNLLEQAFEALVGAMFLEKGYEKTKSFILKNMPLQPQSAASLAFNPKGALQEFLQPQVATNAIEYRLLSSSGPGHAQIFTIALLVQGKEIAQGIGLSKKAAEERAALEALAALKKSAQKKARH